MRFRTFITTLFVSILPTFINATNKQETLYVYGIATTFNDSIVYITEIQQMNDTWVDTKTGFLYSRDNYSYQLRDYLKGIGIAHPTCVTIFGKTRKEAEKKYISIKKRYTTNGKYDVKYLTSHDFEYSAIIPDESEQKASTSDKGKKSKKNK